MEIPWEKIKTFIDGYKTYLGAWIIIVCGFAVIVMAIWLKYDSREFWDFMKFIFGLALGGIGLVAVGMRHAQKKTHNEVCEVLGRMERGRGDGPKGKVRGRRERDGNS